MKTPLAWHNVTHNKVRTAASVMGVCFAIVLVYMQLGFYDSCYRSSTMLLDQLDFDIVLLSPQYVHLRAAGSIPKERLYQAKAVPGVSSVAPCYVGNGMYRNQQDRTEHEIVVLGFDASTQPFQLAALQQQVHRLSQLDAGIMDTLTGRGYGPVERGESTEIDGHSIEIAETYSHGAGFVCDATILVGDRTFSRLFGGYPLSNVSLGLVKLDDSIDGASVASALDSQLPPDVRVWRRDQIQGSEQRFYVEVKPLGVMFSAGVVLAFLVGAVILYQVLASEIMNQFKEYATLKAMGYQDAYLNWIVLQQAWIFAIFGFVPATVMAMIMYQVTRASTNAPMVMTGSRILFVLAISVAMCSLSGLLVSRKLGRADPVELF